MGTVIKLNIGKDRVRLKQRHEPNLEEFCLKMIPKCRKCLETYSQIF